MDKETFKTKKKILDRIRTKKSNQHCIYQVQRKLHFPKLWQLDKSQCSSGTCEARPPLPKGAISLTGRGDKRLWVMPITISRGTRWPPGSLSTTSAYITHFRVHANILALCSSSPNGNFSSSGASLPPATHSPYNPAISSMLSLCLPLSVSSPTPTNLSTLLLLFL